MRELPFVHRAALGHAMALSRDYGAVCIAAACCGASPAEDRGGLAFAARFDHDPAAVFSEVVAACWSAAILASLEAGRAQEHAAVLARRDRALEAARRRVALRPAARDPPCIECRVYVPLERRREVAAAVAAALDDRLGLALARP